MLRIPIVAVTMYITVPCSGLAQTPMLEFQPLISAVGKFNAVMPSKPKEETQEPNSPVGKLQLHIFSVAVSNDLAYIICYLDYPATMPTNDPQAVLKRARDG